MDRGEEGADVRKPERPWDDHFAREFLGEITPPAYPRHPLPWKVRSTPRGPGSRALVFNADGHFVAECASLEIAEFICLAAVRAPNKAMTLIGETFEKEKKTP